MPLPLAALAVPLWLAAAPPAPTGSVCIAPLPGAITQGRWHPLTGTVPRGIPSDDSRPPVRSGQFRVRIDSLPPVAVRTDSATGIGGLARESRHRAVVTFERRAVASFPVRFSPQDPADLCLWYHWGYESWVLDPRKGRAHGCTCR